jgi:hypothetical protein
MRELKPSPEEGRRQVVTSVTKLHCLQSNMPPHNSNFKNKESRARAGTKCYHGIVSL